MGAICPFTIRSKPPTLETAPGEANYDVAQCIGEKCMLYLIIDEGGDGKPPQGACALTLSANYGNIAVNQLVELNANINVLRQQIAKIVLQSKE